MNYYNEFDPHAAAWLNQLITEGLIPNGHVDTRSIKEVSPADVAGYTQCHFFAGIGGWSLALDIAGWPRERPVWTGSCPCQPFSAAGKRQGVSDNRHLWPDFFRLIRECRPDTVFGEQVSSAIRHGWLDGICADLEGAGYAVGQIVLGAHSVGSPHIRQRLYWVADAAGGQSGDRGLQPGWEQRQQPQDSGFGGLADADDTRSQGRDGAELSECASQQTPGPGGAWSHSYWHRCRDGKSRRVPVESPVQCVADGLSIGVVGRGRANTFPLAETSQGRVMLLRGYGNAIVPQVAAEFITAFMDSEKEPWL